MVSMIILKPGKVGYMTVKHISGGGYHNALSNIKIPKHRHFQNNFKENSRVMYSRECDEGGLQHNVPLQKAGA